MPKQKVNIEEIVVRSLLLFKQRSYYNTSVADIAAACGLLKGSLYHYFPSKEALMHAVINYVHDYFKQKVFSVAYDEALLPQQRLEKMFKKAERAILSNEGGDVMGNIGVETARVVPEFAEQIRDFFNEWMKSVETIFAAVTDREEAHKLAEQSLAEFEGALMMTRIYKDPKFIKNALDRMMERMMRRVK